MTDGPSNEIKKVAAKARDKAAGAVSHLWWWLLCRGLVLIALAICALVWPEKTLGILVKILGVYLIVDGVWGTLTYAVSKDRDNALLASALGVIAGLILLFWTGVSARVFMIIVGIWAVLQGIGLYFSVRKQTDVDRESRRWVQYVALALAIAGIVLIAWPNTGVVTVAWLLSAATFLVGAAMVFVATKLRAIARKIKSLKIELQSDSESS